MPYLFTSYSFDSKRLVSSVSLPLSLVLAVGVVPLACSDDPTNTGTTSSNLGPDPDPDPNPNPDPDPNPADPNPFPEPDPDVPAGAAKIRANQVGYLPNAAKVATVVHDATTPRKWQLLGADGKALASGETKVIGDDASSGEKVHLIDFSSFKTAGEGYVLRVGQDNKSHPFDVGTAIYNKLKYDALTYFYHNRSGIAIEMPYAGEQQWARPAGHLPDMAPCAEGIGCSYTLDVTGGWYDAGDHGKYVVNGGISAWTLMNQYERFAALGSAEPFGDSKLNIPERGNNVPDILDEARWEVEFMLRMQVPDGEALAGMVHHKIHDANWTGLPTPPHMDPQPRFLRPVSTAATLNLAATAAQAARLFRDLDPDFSSRCLEAAEKAWTAANAHPALLAPVTDGTGGGAYNDDYVDDEFYWAAVELYLTTGTETYRSAMTSSTHHQTLLGDDGTGSIMTWGWVDALGTISLAVVPGSSEAQAAQNKIVAAADKYLAAIEGEGYRVPFEPGGKGKYPWGSNSFVLNNAIVLALAHDFTGEQKYLDGVASGIDYILGRNPMDKSYVTGYGETPLQNPHHRFWAHQKNDQFPSAPPGCVSGGPNSDVQDPVAMTLAGCRPQTCYIDDIDAWSVNEITINWNSPLAWVVGWLDEKAK